MTLRNACLIALAAASLAAAQVPITQVPIVDAARDGDREAVRALIAQHADVNATEADGMTALHWAVRADDMETAQLLLKAGANVKAGNRYGVTPLSLAATNGSAPMIQALLKAGADPNAVRDSGETVLMTAAHSGNADAVRALLARDANPNAKEKSLGETALMWAAQENHPEAIKALVEYGADKNAHGSVLTIAPFKWLTSGMVSTVLPRGGWTPLMYAARQGSLEAARALADSGADLNAKDPDGTTALVFAIINAHFDVAAMLLDKGADPNVADDTGMAALYAAVNMHTLGKMLSRPSPKLVDSIDAADLVKLLLDAQGRSERAAAQTDARPASQQRRRDYGRGNHGFNARCQNERSAGDEDAAGRRSRSVPDPGRLHERCHDHRGGRSAGRPICRSLRRQ